MRAIILIGRLLLLLLAAGAVVWSFTLGGGHHRIASSVEVHHACPMHPEVTSRTPGECPICRMALERVGKPTLPTTAAASASVSPAPPAHPQAAEAVTAAVSRRVIAREVKAPAWVEENGQVCVILYKDELVGLAPGTRASFFPSGAPHVGMAVRLTAAPAVPRDESTSRACFRFHPRTPANDRVWALGNAGRPEVGWLKLTAKTRDLLVVPSGAVLNSREGPYVLTASEGDGTLTRRGVAVGTLSRGFAVVLSGLREGERVAVSGAFFLDAERRMQSGPEGAVAVLQ